MHEKSRGGLLLLLVYLIAFGLGFAVSTVSDYSLLAKSAVAVLVIVLIIFMGSLDFNNSSVFDPYWSVAPPLMLVYYLVMTVYGQTAGADQVVFNLGQWSLQTGQPVNAAIAKQDLWSYLEHFPRIIVVLVLTAIYGIRLTWNFYRGWPGMKHEDWRYMNFRKSSGKAYWVVSLLGIHLFPALMVFGGTLSLWVVVTRGYMPFGWLDFIAVLLTLGAIITETVADNQLRTFTRTVKVKGTTFDGGLWSVSRHPNYLGEILFWWGLFLFALAANPFYWWVIAGPVAITLLFLLVSIPLMEKRMQARRSDYTDYMKRVPALLPLRLWKRKR